MQVKYLVSGIAIFFIVIFTVIVVLDKDVEKSSEIGDPEVIVEGLPEIVVEELPKIPDNDTSGGDWEIFRGAMLELGLMTPHELDEWIRLNKKHVAKMARLKEREKALGSWKDALKTGTLIENREISGDVDERRFYDTTGDGIADFDILFKDGEPYKWRYLDENGEGYG